MTAFEASLEKVRHNCRGRRIFRSLVYNPPSLDYVRAFRWRLPAALDVLPAPFTPEHMAWTTPVSQLGGSQLLDRWHEKRGYDLLVLHEGRPGLLYSPVRQTRYDRRALVYLVAPIASEVNWAHTIKDADYKINDAWTDPEHLHYILEATW